jgi:hypothetical protein
MSMCRRYSYLTGNTSMASKAGYVYSCTFYMYIMFIPHWKHTTSRPVTRTASHFIYVGNVSTSQETHLWASTDSYRYTRAFISPLRMPASEMLRRAALGRTDVSEECSPSFIRFTRIGELGIL